MQATIYCSGLKVWGLGFGVLGFQEVPYRSWTVSSVMSLLHPLEWRRFNRDDGMVRIHVCSGVPCMLASLVLILILPQN